DDLAEDARRVEARHPGEVDSGLGVAGPFQHPALARLEGEDVAGARHVTGPGARIDHRLHSRGPVAGRDPGAGSVAVVAADQKGGALRFGVVRDHRGKIKLLGTLLSKRSTYGF